MTIHCPNCRTAFRVDPERIPEEGVRTRCSTCASVFRLDRSGAAPGAALASDPESRTPPAVGTEPETAETGEAAEAAEAGQAVAAPGGAERPSTPGLPPSAEPRLTPDVPPTGPDPATAPEEAAAASGGEQSAAGLDSPPAAPAERTPQGREAAGGEQEDRLAAGGGGVRESQGAAGTSRTGDRKPPVFGQQDPDTRAERIARALVSDMVVYNSERRDQALAAGTLRSDFKEEILKSWEEYVEQVGEEKAKKSPHFRNALNQILARGQSVF